MDAFFRMRRSSHTSAFGNQEPLIVVEESENCEKAEEASTASSQRQSLDIESPENPYLLSPWRDARETRKHSLPTPPCTSGITASQVRRLSERGGEGSGPSPREQAFLATLYSTPAPQPGGRRHSVVTISRVPPTMFGRSRRESIAAVPAAGQRPASYSRRESNSGPPPSTDHRGSIHNLQLDIMDDIVQARKARMKLWNTSNERVCEVQTLDEAGTGSSSPMRYTNRRYSDFVGTALPPIQSFRRASELPVSPSGAAGCSLTPSLPIATEATAGAAAAAAAAAASAGSAKPKSGRMGIVCTNTDLISLLSSLASSATEINRCGEKDATAAASPLTPLTAPFKSLLKTPTSATSATSATAVASPTLTADVMVAASHLQPPQAGEKLRKNRSNSFDSSLYHSIKQLATGGALSPGSTGTDGTAKGAPSIEPGWFTKRHQPMARRKSSLKSPSATLTFANEALERLRRETRSVGRVTILDPPSTKQQSEPVGIKSGSGSGSSSAASASSSSSTKASSGATTKESRSPLNKLKWDGRSAIVDARMIGHAIENFITGSSSSSASSTATSGSAGGGAANSGGSPSTGTGTSLLSKKTLGGGKDGGTGGRSASKKSSTSSWFGKATDDDDSNDTCDSSLCSTLKDLFVK